MSVQVETLEKNTAKLTVEVSAEELENALQEAYLHQKNRISLPGFRKGKVPRAMIEKMYGPAIFYEDAANRLINEHYGDAAKESGLDIVSRPEFDITQIEKGKPFLFTATVATKPEVVLGEYKGVEVPRTDTNVTDEEVDAELAKEQEKNSRLVTVEDRPAKEGDTLELDYAGTVDGIAFDGGTAEGQSLKLGSNTFIPGFEEQLVGVNAGEEKDVEVTFPEEYHAKDLAGKAAVFHCTVHKISETEIPELDDEFAQDVSEFDTLAEYRADVKKKIEERKQEAAKQSRRDHAVSRASAKSVIEIPEAMLKTQAEQQVENFARRLQSQGLSFEQYMKYLGSDYDAMIEQMKPQAEKQIMNSLTLEKIAEVEGLQASDEDVAAEIKRIADLYGMEVEKFEETFGESEKEHIREDLKIQKAIDFLADNAVEVDEPEEKETEE